MWNAVDPYAEIARLELRLAEEKERGLDTTDTAVKLLELGAVAEERKDLGGALEASIKRYEAVKLAKSKSASNN